MQHHLNQSGELERILVVIPMPGGLQVFFFFLVRSEGRCACLFCNDSVCVFADS